MAKKVIIIGGFHEIIELCEDIGVEIVGIIDNSLAGEYLGYPILGNDNDAEQIYKKYKDVPVAITPDLPVIRERLFQHYSAKGFGFQTLISGSAKISKSSTIGRGTIIQSGVNISSFCEIGDFVKLNVNANIMHDTIVGNFSTVAPNALLLGRVKVDEFCYIGANATILPNIVISRASTVGAGAVVTKDTNENQTVIGIPAKQLNKF